MNKRNLISVSAVLLLSVATGVAAAQTSASQITITPTTAQKVISGTPDRFTGLVRVQSLFDSIDPSGTSGGVVTFQPGARSAWHTHPLGQILIVTDGVGWIQQWGGPVQIIRKGDVVWIPPGVKHWHGATPTTAMTAPRWADSLAVQSVGSITPRSMACSDSPRVRHLNMELAASGLTQYALV